MLVRSCLVQLERRRSLARAARLHLPSPSPLRAGDPFWLRPPPPTLQASSLVSTSSEVTPLALPHRHPLHPTRPHPSSMTFDYHNFDPTPPTYRILFKPVEDCETEGCYLDVLLPASAKPGDKLPVVFYSHGGAFSVGASSDLAHHQVRYMLNKGFAVLSPEYRLCPHVKQSDCREDVLDAYLFLQHKLNDVLTKESGGKAPFLDGSRCFAAGGSAGGTTSLTLAIDIHSYNEQHPNAHIPQVRATLPAYPAVHVSGFQDNPVSVLEEDMPKQDPEKWEAVQKLFKGKVCASFKTNSMPLDETHPRTIWCNAGVRYNCLNSYLWGNPPYPAVADFIDFMGPWFPPTYVLAAEKDSLIPVQHSYDVVDQLKKHGVEVHLGLGNEAEHGFTEWNPKFWPEGVDWWEVIEKGLNWAIGKTSP